MKLLFFFFCILIFALPMVKFDLTPSWDVLTWSLAVLLILTASDAVCTYKARPASLSKDTRHGTFCSVILFNLLPFLGISACFLLYAVFSRMGQDTLYMNVNFAVFSFSLNVTVPLMASMMYVGMIYSFHSLEHIEKAEIIEDIIRSVPFVSEKTKQEVEQAWKQSIRE